MTVVEDLDLEDPDVQAMLDVRPGASGAPLNVGAGKGFDDDGDDDAGNGPGLINVDMKQWATGSLEDPLRHAVGLRNAQDAPKMRFWNSLPLFFQNTIFHGEQDASIQEVRRGSIEERLARATSCKEEGNRLLKEGRLKDAVEAYEKGAGVLRYIECFRPDWKNDDGSYKGIEDEWLRVEDALLTEKASPSEQDIRQLLASLYLNLALAAQKQEDWMVMFAATNEVITKVDEENPKAWFRRAQARIGPMTCRDSDVTAAIEDLQAAVKLAPSDKAVRSLLSDLRQGRRAQQTQEKERCQRIFQHGGGGLESDRAKREEPQSESGGYPTSRSQPKPQWDLRDPKVQRMLDVHPGPGSRFFDGDTELPPLDGDSSNTPDLERLQQCKVKVPDEEVSIKREPCSSSTSSKAKPVQVASTDGDDDPREKGGGLIDLDMNQFGSGTMQDPLRHAMGMRTAQDNKKMHKWLSWPSLFQNTIFHAYQDAEVAAIRKESDVHKRVEFSRGLKEQGTALLQNSDFDKAIQAYEKAAGVLRYVECTRPDWRNADGSFKGIEDDWLQVRDETVCGEGPQAADARTQVVSCYLNIALAGQKQENWATVLAATSEALKLDDSCVKALVRRAHARVTPMTATEEDWDLALADLTHAAKAAPQDKVVRDELQKLRAQRKAQREAQKAKFGGLFQRGQVVTNDPRLEGDRPDPSKLDLRDPKVQQLLDIYPGPNFYVPDQDEEPSPAN
mmetsp:Transcript_11589/g.26993  ORF Transcript_11589/g.26993 Transcript_11589/m.26993 type:complete len:732 (+) Transcript_11589:97-2292(+)